jgi:hypothetical protein
MSAASASGAPPPPSTFKTWKAAGAAFLEMKVSTDGALALFSLKDSNSINLNINKDTDIKSLLTSIGKWVHEGTVNQNLGKMLSKSFTRMLQLEQETPTIDQSVAISSSQLLALSVDLEERLIKVLDKDEDWEEMGYTDVMRRVFGDTVGGIKPFRPKNQEKRKIAAKKKIESHTKILHTLESKLQKKCVEYSKSVDFFSSDYDAIGKAIASLEETIKEVEERKDNLEVEEVAAEHGHGFIVESVRDTIIAPVANITQCESVIGKYEPTDICYLCGLSFNAGVGKKEKVQVDCEHVLGVLLAGMYINLVQGGSRIFNKEPQNYREIMKLEYLWAHHCCNIVKLDEPFIKKIEQRNGSYKYVVHTQKIVEMIHGIISKVEDTDENLGCRNLKRVPKWKDTIKNNEINITKHMKAFCDFINGQIDGIKAIVGPEEGVDPDLMASQIFEAFIKFRFFGRIHNSLIVKGLINAASIFNYKTGLQTVVWPTIGEPNGESSQQGESSQGGGRYKRKQYGGGDEYIDDLFDASLIMFLNIFTEAEFSDIVKASKVICNMNMSPESIIKYITYLFLQKLSNSKPSVSTLLQPSRVLNDKLLNQMLSDNDITTATQRNMVDTDKTYNQMKDTMITLINPNEERQRKMKMLKNVQRNVNNERILNQENSFAENSKRQSMVHLNESIEKAKRISSSLRTLIQLASNAESSLYGNSQATEYGSSPIRQAPPSHIWEESESWESPQAAVSSQSFASDLSPQSFASAPSPQSIVSAVSSQSFASAPSSQSVVSSPIFPSSQSSLRFSSAQTTPEQISSINETEVLNSQQAITNQLISRNIQNNNNALEATVLYVPHAIKRSSSQELPNEMVYKAPLSSKNLLERTIKTQFEFEKLLDDLLQSNELKTREVSLKQRQIEEFKRIAANHSKYLEDLRAHEANEKMQNKIELNRKVQDESVRTTQADELKKLSNSHSQYETYLKQFKNQLESKPKRSKQGGAIPKKRSTRRNKASRTHKRRVQKRNRRNTQKKNRKNKRNTRK